MPKWSQNDMGSAIKAVQEGKLSIRSASVTYGVPYTTLNDKLR